MKEKFDEVWKKKVALKNQLIEYLAAIKKE